MKQPFMVSVRLMTYNQELYIKDAMVGIMMQEASFPVEVVVGDDFSTDRTLAIIKSFASTELIHIRILPREKGDKYFNKRQELGRLYNFSNIIENCQGKYIALLDGDDYWTDPQKLQKQVDFLEANPDCVLCHHWHKIAEVSADNVWVEKVAPVIGQGYYPNKKASVEKIFTNEMRAKSRTIMFRNVLHKFPDWFYKVAYGDVPLTMILGKQGNFGFIDEAMAVYRITRQGVSTRGIEDWLFTFNHFIEWIRIWEYGNLYYGSKYEKEALVTIYHFYGEISKRYRDSYKIFRMMLSFNLFESKLSIYCRLQIFFKLLHSFIKARIKKLLK